MNFKINFQRPTQSKFNNFCSVGPKLANQQTCPQYHHRLFDGNRRGDTIKTRVRRGASLGRVSAGLHPTKLTNIQTYKQTHILIHESNML